MTAWKGLLKKEYRLGRDHLIGTLIIQGVLIGIYFFLAMKYGKINVINAPLGLMITINMIYIPSYVLLSLKKEQMQLWLHNPNPAWKLVLAKLLNAFFSFFITLSVSLLFSGYFILDILNQHIQVISWILLFKFGLLGFLYFIGISILISFLILFVWVIYHWIKNFIGKWSGTVVVGLTVFSFWGIGKFTSSKIYETVTHLGRVNLKGGSILTIDQGHFTLNYVPVYFGTLVFYLFLTILLFAISSWLIDHKVEV